MQFLNQLHKGHENKRKKSNCISCCDCGNVQIKPHRKHKPHDPFSHLEPIFTLHKRMKKFKTTIQKKLDTRNMHEEGLSKDSYIKINWERAGPVTNFRRCNSIFCLNQVWRYAAVPCRKYQTINCFNIYWVVSVQKIE